jgi:hypothetical protein
LGFSQPLWQPLLIRLGCFGKPILAIHRTQKKYPIFFAGTAFADGVLYAGWSTYINFIMPIPNVPTPEFYSWTDFYAFNASTGDVIWSHKNYPHLGSLTVDDGVLFLGATSSYPCFSAFNASTGALLWNNTLNGLDFGDTSAAICNGFILVIVLVCLL